MLYNMGYPDSASIFESALTAQVGAGGVDVVITTDKGPSGGGGFNTAANPPATNQGLNVLALILIAVLLWVALR